MGTTRNLICISAICYMLPLTSCASNPSRFDSGPPPAQVKISTQPANDEVPMGRPATFSVAAIGTAPIQYQWSKNGTPIEGATSPSYTTSNVTFADSGGTYQVTVSNAANSVTSSTATLTVGPRAPALGDLRYLLMEQVYQQRDLVPGPSGNIFGGSSASFPNLLGTPLTLGTGGVCYPGANCYWGYVVYYLPAYLTGLTMHYSSGPYRSLSSDLQSIASSNGVIISLDLEPANHLYAVAWAQTQAGGFDYRMETVSPSEFATTVAADGASSRVVTAVGLDASTGMADVISYAWQGDTTTVFDTTAQIVQLSPPQNIPNAAIAMAAQGYIISAFGGNDANGYALVAMRVHGDTTPRPIVWSVNGVTGQANSPYAVPVTTLVYLDDPGYQILVEEQ